MSSPLNFMQNPANAPAQLQTQSMELKQSEIKALGQSKLSDAEKSAKLRETCESFESIFIQKMWQQMRATLPQENPLVGKEEKFWQSMYDQEFSKHMAKSGGIGLADMMYEQLSENLVNVSKTTAEAAQKSKGFEIHAAPLLPMPKGLAHAQGNTAQPDLLADASMESGAQASWQTGVQANAQTNTSTAATHGDARFSGLYENVPAAQAGVHGAVPTAGTTQHSAENASSVQQFLAGLQAKQGLASSNTATGTTGPQRAQQAELAVGNQPPLNGVLPANSAPQVVRYTTNVPAGQRKGNAEEQLKELLAKASAQQAQQANMAAYGQNGLMGQTWGQPTAQQQSQQAVQDALSQAHTAVGGAPSIVQPNSPFVAPVSAPATLQMSSAAAQAAPASASPYTVPPAYAPKQQS